MLSKASERRADIINYLYFVNDRITTPELARMFDVGLRTMERDITEISLKHRIETVQGRKGGIYLSAGERRGKFSCEEFETLYKIWSNMAILLFCKLIDTPFFILNDVEMIGA